MKRKLTYTLVLVAVLAVSFAFTYKPAETVENTSHVAATIEWLTFEEAMERNKTNPKKIFIDVYTDWCGWCKVMDKKTFSNPIVANYMSEKYYAVKFNAEQREDVIFRDHTFKFVASGRRGYHELAAALMQNKMSYPTVVFLDEEMNLLSPVPGFQPPESFHQIMQYFGDDAYKNTSWETFQTDYQSPFTGSLAEEGK